MYPSKFETALTRAVAIGGLGCFFPFGFLFTWIGFTNIQKWQMYVAVTITLIALGLVNKTRELVRAQEAESPVATAFVTGMKLLAIGASFLIGSILSMGFVLLFLLFFRGV